MNTWTSLDFSCLKLYPSHGKTVSKIKNKKKKQNIRGYTKERSFHAPFAIFSWNFLYEKKKKAQLFSIAFTYTLKYLNVYRNVFFLLFQFSRGPLLYSLFTPHGVTFFFSFFFRLTLLRPLEPRMGASLGEIRLGHNIS